MAYGLIWSDQAELDISELAAYIESTGSLRRAKTVLREIERVAEASCDFPFAAREIPEFGDPLRRETFAFKYRVMFRVEQSSINIIRVVYGSRPLTTVHGSFEESEQEAYASQ
jgi:toxin ParE1/3/4